ncbi:MAG: hypothetical protein MJ076_01830 [Clostridia bacterium]|nr:hypothetical protein [Clostridia bacterium]
MKLLKSSTVILSFVLILAFVVIVFMVKTIVQDKKTENEYNQSIAQLKEKEDALIEQRDKIKVELNNVKREYNIHMVGTATSQILFMGTYKTYYNDYLPLMNSYGYKGILGVSLNDLPGLKGRISVNEFKKMLSSGWEYCIVWDGLTKLDIYLDKIENKLNDIGFEMPETFYFPPGFYKSNYEKTLLIYNFKNIIQNGENGMSLYGKYSSNGIWYPGARSWNYVGVKSDIKSLIEMGGNYTFTVSVKQTSKKELFKTFENMLKYIAEFGNDKLMITTFSDGNKMYYEKLEATKELDEQLESRIEELNREISEYDKKIKNVYVE